MEHIVRGEKSVDPETGFVRTWRNVSSIRFSGNSRSIAESFLHTNRKQFGLLNEENAPAFNYEKTSRGIFYETFFQTISDIPVFRGDITITVNRENQVTFARNNARYFEHISSQTPSISQDIAFQIARDFIQPGNSIFWQKEPTLYYLVQNKTAYLVWLVEFESREPLGSWQVFVDAVSGEVRALENRIVFSDGHGMIWDPDPLSSAYAKYGDPGFSDFNDNDTDELNEERFVGELLDITFAGGVYRLEGPFVKVEDWDPPTVPVVTSVDPDSFNYTRSQSGFEDVLVYYFIDKTQRYIQSLGFNNVNNEDQVCDPHGADGADNSYYYPGSDAIAWGEGGVDDAEDADVILHEYGHAIQHDQVPSWGGGQEGAMGEGFGDYWAGSHSLTASAHHSNWVFNWDGHNGFWPGRILDAPYHYPENANGQIHDSGQLWSAGLWDIHTDPAMSRVVIDALVLQHHFMIGSSASMADAAAAIIQADLDIFNGEHYNLIVEKFGNRGFIDPDDYPPLSDSIDPNPPANVTAYSDDTMPTGIQLSWDDPTELFGGGSIGPFAINISRGGEFLMEVSQNMETYLDERLEEGQSYIYSLFTRQLSDDSTSYSVRVTGFAGGAPSILIWDMGNSSTNSTNILDAISAASGRSTYATNDLFMFGEDLVSLGYDVIFVLLGIFSNNYVLSEGTEVGALIDYLESGGNIYMEGGETWAYDAQTSLHNYFGINGLADGTGDLSAVEGVEGTFTEGMSFTYSGQNSYIDHIEPSAESAFAILVNSTIGYTCGVANDAGIYRTIGGSFELGGLTGGPGLTALMDSVLIFFDEGGSPCEKGDVNSDGAVDVFDVIKTVNIILGINENPTEQELCSADYDDDEEVLVFDIIKMVNFILGIGMNKEMIVTDAVLHQVGDFLYLEADGPIAGLQFSIKGSKSIEVIEISGMDVVLYEKEGETEVLLFSMGGNTIRKESILKVTGNYSISGLVISDRSGNRVVSKFTSLPMEFVLRQNYPNPFNPVTTIAFDLPEAGHVSLVIYDILGREVQLLVDDRYNGGTYSVMWDATRFSTGVYFYKLNWSGKMLIGKMMVIK